MRVVRRAKRIKAAIEVAHCNLKKLAEKEHGLCQQHLQSPNG
jgi:hypothetical protein